MLLWVRLEISNSNLNNHIHTYLTTALYTPNSILAIYLLVPIALATASLP